MKKKKILVFPCGSEIGLEIHKALCFSTHFELVGGSSLDDHGRFVFDNYVGDLPFYNDSSFLERLKEVIRNFEIDLIYPAMDSVIHFLKVNEQLIGIPVIAPPPHLTQLCTSKKATYARLSGVIKVPKTYNEIDEIESFPVFVKPDFGYGSRGAKIVKSRDELRVVLDGHKGLVISEFLPGEEYTIDCFTDINGNLLYADARVRNRISNGISVNSRSVPNQKEFLDVAVAINNELKMFGAWFFQVKQDNNNELTLLEVAARIAGTSAVQRAKGVNLPLMNVFNSLNMPVSILANDYEVEIDRALQNRFKLNISFQRVYLDFDDTVIVNGLVNLTMIQFVFKCINKGIEVILITKHEFDIHQTLEKNRLQSIFHQIIHLKKHEEKWRYMDPEKAIFVDDSFQERLQVKQKLNIPVFGPDNIETLI